MNISDDLRPNFLFCSAAFLEFPKTYGYAGYHDEDNFKPRDLLSELIKSPEAICNTIRWRIDGTTFGKQYSAIPLFLKPLPPARIDVEIPDQRLWDPDTWAKLGAKQSAVIVGSDVVAFGITRYLESALEKWSSSIPDFERQYRELPFASKIVFSSITGASRPPSISFKPNFQLWRQMLSVQHLQNLWKNEGIVMPEVIDYKGLSWKRQLSRDICLVTLAEDSAKELLVFKSQPHSMPATYHEIKIFLSVPAHQSLAKRPQYLVTTTISGRDGSRVCGFLIKYYALGTLHSVLPERRLNKSLTLHSQFRWAKNIGHAFLHLLSAKQFYSDFRMDNVVLDTDTDGSEIAVLIDLEQSRNIYNWAPPEIYYMEWLAELGIDAYSHHEIPHTVKEKCRDLLKQFLSLRGHSLSIKPVSKTYDNPTHGWYFPWIVSTPAEREAAQVYLFGKALYCLFEGYGDPEQILGRVVAHEIDHRFPEFTSTPAPLRELIRRCTAGARQWKHQEDFTICRRDGTIYPKGQTGRNGEPRATLPGTILAIKQFWQKEVNKAQHFMAIRIKHELGEGTAEDIAQLDFLGRPTLCSVLDELDTVEKCLCYQSTYH